MSLRAGAVYKTVLMVADISGLMFSEALKGSPAAA